jgi:hypothetical protein
MHNASLVCRTTQFLALEMKRVRILHVLTARNLCLFQCMHGRSTKLWRQVTWCGYVAWLFCSAAWCMHGWESPPKLTFQTSLLDTPSKRSSLLHLVAVLILARFLSLICVQLCLFPAIHPNRLYCLCLEIKSHLRDRLFIQSTPHIDLVDRRPQLKIVFR